MKQLYKYIDVWLALGKRELQQQLSSKTSAILFFIGKLIRFITFFAILFLLKKNTAGISDYSIDQIVIFFLTFNLIDITSQMFLRGVYSFSGKVRSGELDYYLAQPMSILFRSVAGVTDFNDMILFFPTLAFTIWYISRLHPPLTASSIFLYVLLIANGLLIAFAFHVFVICIGILTTEVDNAIAMYRDLSQTGRFPMEIYREPLRAVITFVIPIGIMMNVPARILLGDVSPQLIFTAFAIGIGIFLLSMKAWSVALKQYTSASS